MVCVCHIGLLSRMQAQKSLVMFSKLIYIYRYMYILYLCAWMHTVHVYRYKDPRYVTACQAADAKGTRRMLPAIQVCRSFGALALTGDRLAMCQALCPKIDQDTLW